MNKEKSQRNSTVRETTGELFSQWKESKKTPKINFSKNLTNTTLKKSLLTITLLLVLANIMIFTDLALDIISFID